MGLKGFFSEHIKTIHFSWRRVWIIVVAVVVFVSIFLVGALVYARTYSDRVLPGVYLGDIHVGGMERQELTEYLQNMQTKLMDEGIHFTFQVDGHTKDFTISPQKVSEDAAVDLINFDIES